MAIRRRQLKQRITALGSNQGAAAAAYHPAGTSATPMVMPIAGVVVGAAPGGQYVTLGSMEFDPMWTPDGALIPSVAPGRWGQLRAAGQP
jgi:hypothetical protein